MDKMRRDGEVPQGIDIGRSSLTTILVVERMDDKHFFARLIVSVGGVVETENLVVHTIEELHGIADRMASSLYHVSKGMESKERAEKEELKSMRHRAGEKDN